MRRSRIQPVFAILALLTALIGVAIWWLFYDNGSTAQSFSLDLAAIRAESARLDGPGPVRIEVETVSHQRVPEIAMVAGASWTRVDLVRTSYRLVWASGVSGIIDTTYDRETAKNVDAYDEDAFNRLTQAMRTARFILVTHEHSDHIGGLKSLAGDPTIAARALVTPEQLDSPAGATPPWPPSARQHLTVIRYSGDRAIAPGVVLIKAPGHTPGSQMVYVRLADGSEYIFMGDTASMADNIATGHIRSHLVTDWMSHDDRAAVLAQVTALRNLHVRNPAVILVPGHDGEALSDLERRGALQPRFSRGEG